MVPVVAAIAKGAFAAHHAHVSCGSNDDVAAPVVVGPADKLGHRHTHRAHAPTPHVQAEKAERGVKAAALAASIAQSCMDGIASAVNEVEKVALDQSGLPAAVYLGAKMLLSLGMWRPVIPENASPVWGGSLEILRRIAEQVNGEDPQLASTLEITEGGFLAEELVQARHERTAAQGALVEAAERCQSKCAFSSLLG